MTNIAKLSSIWVTVVLLLAALSLTGCHTGTAHSETGQPESSPDESSLDRTLVSVHVTREPNKTRYYMYESLDSDGIKVIASFSDNSEEVIDNGELTYSGFDSARAGKQNITVTYKDKDDAFSVTITAGSFAVTFNNNGGNSQANPQAKTVTQPSTGVDILPAPPAKTNYDFVEWNTKADGSGISFTADSLVISNFTVYAQWTIKTYNITFNSNGGSAIAAQTIDHGEKAVEPSKPPVINNAYLCKFDGWYTDNTTFINRWVFTGNAVTANTELYAKWIPYELGDTGPGGGKIYYRDVNGFTVTVDETSETCYYLEASPKHLGCQEWSSTTALEDTGAEIGTGKQNTKIIVTKLNRLPLLDWYAAQVCDNYTNNGFDDWFLPSKNELNQLYLNRNYVGNLGNYEYWSSTQGGLKDTVWFQQFDIGNQTLAVNLTIGKYVRAVRAF